MIWILLFIFGLLIGSFLNVVALRYDENQSLLGPRIATGRSHCVTCQVNLKWYELVPLFSFIVQGAKCRHCKHSLNWQYPIVELITGVLTAALPWFLYNFYGAAQTVAQGQSLFWFYCFTALWLIVAYTTVVLSAIDVRLKIIPDQCNVLLGLIGLVFLAGRYASNHAGLLANFSGSYGSVLGAPHDPVVSALIAVTFSVILFGGSIYFSGGRGMGMGDLKLAIPLALILGWPDTLVAFMGAFVIGSIIGLLLIANRRATMKAAIPFGPFMIIGFYVAIFYGESILRWYFSLI